MDRLTLRRVTAVQQGGGGRVPTASVGSVHLFPYSTLAIQFRTQFLHPHFCKITWLSSAQMMEANVRIRVLRLRIDKDEWQASGPGRLTLTVRALVTVWHLKAD